MLEAIASRFGVEASEIRRIPTGLIHQTHLITARDGRRYVLQAVSPIFSRGVQADMDRVTRHLESKGLVTPRLVPPAEGALFVEDAGTIWRLLTFIEGTTRDRLETTEDAGEAGRALAIFHSALADYPHGFEARRLGVHDTPKHLAVLRDAVASHGTHRLHREVEPISRDLLARAERLPDLGVLPERVVHGDPKINNLIFDAKGRARCWVDLDTVAPMPIPIELGDAFRSWCNPAGENASEVRFDRRLFQSALTGYAEGITIPLAPAEKRSIAVATEMIMLELSARFLADALNERYFGWDSTRFESRGDHNLLRARGQLALAVDFAAQRDEVEKILARALPG